MSSELTQEAAFLLTCQRALSSRSTPQTEHILGVFWALVSDRTQDKEKKCRRWKLQKPAPAGKNHEGLTCLKVAFYHQRLLTIWRPHCKKTGCSCPNTDIASALCLGSKNCKMIPLFFFFFNYCPLLFLNYCHFPQNFSQPLNLFFRRQTSIHSLK